MAAPIVVRGARVHNLRGVDVDIPRGALCVVTGLSGSGKSSLAFDTIYAESQRRYVESLSIYARQFLDQMTRPDADIIEGLSPAIAIQQKVPVRNPRSTVATTTDVHDYLRLLFARVGQVHCYQCGQLIRRHTVQEIVDRVLDVEPGTRYTVVAPMVRGQRGSLEKTLEKLAQDGYIRVAIDGEIGDLSLGIPRLDKRIAHNIDVHVDRLVAKQGVRRRLTDSVELALGLSGGRVDIAFSPATAGSKRPADRTETPRLWRFTERFACIDCDLDYPELEPRAFSFNSPQGACPDCAGLGFIPRFDPELIVGNPARSINEGVIVPFARRAVFRQMLDSVCSHFAIDMDTPWRDLDRQKRDLLLHGSPETVPFEVNRRRFNKPFEGVMANLQRRLADADRKRSGAASGETGDADQVYDDLRRFMSETTCEACGGARLRVESRHVTVGGSNLAEIGRLSLSDARDFFAGLSLSSTERAIADRLLGEIRARLGFLTSVGVGYLSLDRRASTLSSGEMQRIRLATQIGSSLVGVLYVLDEPSIGLHPRDSSRLLDALFRLRELGNTVLLVEHDEAIIRAADHVIDMGEGAGVLGGRVLCAGPVDHVAACAESLTGRYLARKRAIEIPRERRSSRRWIEVEHASTHNLAGVDAAFPIGVLTCVTGVSGSGKSSLVVDTLLPALRQRLSSAGAIRPGTEFSALRGAHHVDRVIAVDHTPIGRTPRSNPASYTGLLGLIRDVFAQLPESRARGYKAGRFSFNVKGGRCDACHGDGVIAIEMHFLPDVYVECDACGGKRYNRETLEIRYKGHSIADVLAMSVSRAIEFWAHVPKIRARLEAMREVGLGYVELGQSANTLSGGEAQRLKLSRQLVLPSGQNHKASGRTVYILDEPTTGLHFEDVRRLLSVLSLLIEEGNTVIVIEHHLDVIKCADYILDLGPEGGAGGGRIIARGTPEEVARVEQSHTGHALREVLSRSSD
ncbi:MAG: excinuclease ABC subunit UvrA [Proteobacteria bacterium]|nr:excinuclease ABC subunit UvrA [Pseudomonadota bacterium]